jgi:putative glycosyltransferase (TIGR04372 family)
MDDHMTALGPPILSFTEAEELRGQRLLREMGIPPGAWFVSFQARDNAFYAGTSRKQDLALTTHRNCSITSYLDAMKYVVSCGGYALRVGSIVGERLPDLGDSRIVDYASDHRSDFGDIYVLAKCKFFVGCNSGLATVPMMFNVPVVDANSLIMPTRTAHENAWPMPLNVRDLFLPRPIFSKALGRPLKFRETPGPDVRYFALQQDYEAAGLDVLENSAAEIVAAVKEMNERLDGRYEYTDKDEELQAKFRSLIDPAPRNFDTFARVGGEFLRTNRPLLD